MADKQRIPKTKVSTKKAWRKILLDHQIMIMKRIRKNRQEMRKEIKKEVEKQFGDKIEMIEGLYKDVIIQKKIFIEKGFIRQEDINKKYEELKGK